MFLAVSAIYTWPTRVDATDVFKQLPTIDGLLASKRKFGLDKVKKIIKLISRKRFYKYDNINYMNISYLKWALLMHCIKSFVILPCSDALCNN